MISKLLAHGLSLFPIAAGAKAPPLLPRWQDSSTNDAGQIAEWAVAFPECNFGIHCSGLIVLDVDVGKGGGDTVFDLDLEHGLPPTLTVNTPSGGQHRFYRYAPGVRNSVERLGKGLDVRSDNGYAVAAGSVVNGKTYTFANDRPIADAPQWLVDMCTAAPAAREKASREMPKGVNVELACTRAREWLDGRAPAIQGQGGDAHTFSTVARVRDFGVPQGLAAEVLTEWNDRCEPAWDHSDLDRKIDNVYCYAENAPGCLACEVEFDDLTDQPVEPPPAVLDQFMYGPGDVELVGLLHNDYLIKGWLDAGSQALMFGKWNAGKSFIALDMAVHIALGKPWFENRVKQGGVLYFGYEGEAAFKRRVYALSEKFTPEELASAPLRVRPMNDPIATKDPSGHKPAGQEQIETAIETFKHQTGAYPALVIVDPLRNALPGSDSDPELTGPYLRYLKGLTKRYGCATLTVHHPGHGDAERARGDSAIEASMDTVIRVDGGNIESTKQRDDLKATLHYELKRVVLGVDQDGDERTTCVVEQVTENSTDPKLTAPQRRVYDHLRELADKGHVKKSVVRGAGKVLGIDRVPEIVAVLLKKRYLELLDDGYEIGVGPHRDFGSEFDDSS